jgi:hypothetical protein
VEESTSAPPSRAGRILVVLHRGNLAVREMRTQDVTEERQELSRRPEVRGPARHDVLSTADERVAQRPGARFELNHERTFREERRRLASRPAPWALIICIV